MIQELSNPDPAALRRMRPVSLKNRINHWSVTKIFDLICDQILLMTEKAFLLTKQSHGREEFDSGKLEI